jgi:tRNA A37 threonylcarbamoyladenosine dehydratase
MVGEKDFQERTRLLVGEAGVACLQKARVAMLGLGGVGSYALEALARAGIGAFWLIDADVIELSNLNRQLLALRSTLGAAKTEAARARVADINPRAHVRCEQMRFTAESGLDFAGWDYVVDAIDEMNPKVALALACRQAGTPLIAAMGAGRRLQTAGFSVCDVGVSRGDPLARRYRRLLRERGVAEGVKVVVSAEPPLPQTPGEAVGSVSFVPAVVGLLMAGEVVRELLGKGKLGG